MNPRLILLVLALLGARALLPWLTGLELHFDEAQYWEWSRHLDWSYATKGPLVAWLIALSTGYLGDVDWAVRLPAWIAHGAWIVVLFHFTRAVWQDERAAWWAVALGLGTPVFFLLGQVMSTDVFLFLAWTLALWAAHQALYEDRPWAWLGFGLAIGIGALGKLSIGLLPFFLGFYLLATTEGRAALRTWQFWAGIGLLFVSMSPVIIWNANHDWWMLRHELGHLGGNPQDAPYHWADFIVFLLGQLGALGLILPLFALPYWLIRPERKDLRLIWWLSVLTFAFFAFKSLFGKIQPNWPAPAYIGLLILLAGKLPEFSDWRKNVFRGGFVLFGGLLALLLAAPWLGFTGSHDPLKKLKAWQEPVNRAATQSPETDFIVTSYYQLASELAFYWPRPMTVYLTGSTQRRFNQYDFWPSVNREAGKPGLYVDTKNYLPLDIHGKCAPLPPVHAPDEQDPIRTLYLWYCPEWPKTDWPEPGWH